MISCKLLGELCIKGAISTTSPTPWQKMTMKYLQGVMGLLINTNDTANYFRLSPGLSRFVRLVLHKLLEGCLNPFWQMIEISEGHKTSKHEIGPIKHCIHKLKILKIKASVDGCQENIDWSLIRRG